jgi:hypothetical protein
MAVGSDSSATCAHRRGGKWREARDSKITEGPQRHNRRLFWFMKRCHEKNGILPHTQDIAIKPALLGARRYSPLNPAQPTVRAAHPPRVFLLAQPIVRPVLEVVNAFSRLVILGDFRIRQVHATAESPGPAGGESGAEFPAGPDRKCLAAIRSRSIQVLRRLDFSSVPG